MRRLMVCVKQIGESSHCEVTVFEEQGDEAGTEAEERMVRPFIYGLKVITEEIGNIEQMVELENPFSELANRIRDRFKE